ncbi:MmcB family DNA repair protein [Cohnella yongneupensis]|uniref:MmcB family DNA repair protein n=1 Tax=Cohnella yongneupensis TaxID=425006 RepID=A0ABW0QXT0_9BACL
MSVRAEHIKLALAKKHTEDLFLTEVKTGRTWDNKELLKFDAFAMKKSWANPCLYGYEVKVSRSDFLQDNKWPGYMAYCNRFAFVCPKGLIQPEELPEEVGVIWYYPDSGALVNKRPAKHRIIEISTDLYQYILMSRIESDRNPFFSSKREYFEAYLADKEERRNLGKSIGSKLLDDNILLRIKLDNALKKVESQVDDSKLLDRVLKVLTEHQIRVNHWSHWEDDLRTALTSSIDPNVAKSVKRLIAAADELKSNFEPKLNSEEQ